LVDVKRLTVAKNAVEKQCYAYRDRKGTKEISVLYGFCINAGARLEGMSYSQFMGKVKANGHRIEP
jgi:large subunit ribosomal protein L20